MIHQYINNGYHIVLDVNSGSVHSVDALLYDAVEVLAKIVPDMEKPMPLTDDQKKAVREALVCKYSAEDIEDALSDIQELIDAEELFAADIYKDYVIDFKKRQTVVRHSAFILPMTATLPASTASQRKASTMDAAPS